MDNFKNCIWCSKSFSSKWYTIKHQQNCKFARPPWQIANPPPSGVVCNLCNKTLSNVYNLNRHQKITCNKKHLNNYTFKKIN